VSEPAGLSLTLDGQPYAGGSVLGVVGMTRSIGAPTPQSLGGATYMFRSWTGGGNATHNITTRRLTRPTPRHSRRRKAVTARKNVGSTTPPRQSFLTITRAKITLT
jgi:hypothetical protein